MPVCLQHGTIRLEKTEGGAERYMWQEIASDVHIPFTAGIMNWQYV